MAEFDDGQDNQEGLLSAVKDLEWCIDRRPWLPVWRTRLTASIGSSAVRSSA